MSVSTVSPDHRTALHSPLAAVAVTLMFAANGTIIGAYVGLIPALRDKLGLAPLQISLLLLSGGVAGLLGMQLGGRLADRMGARRIVLAAFPLLIAGPVVMALAGSLGVAIVGLLLVGFGNGLIDVSMNALGVQVEAARRIPIMSRFHAFWSLGNFVGAALVLLVGLVAGNGGAVLLPVALLAGALGLLSLFWLWRFAPESAPVVHRNESGGTTRVPLAAWLLGLMAIGFGIGEGTAMDWSSLHVVDVAGVRASLGALGIACVAGFMVLIRLLGDRLVARFGRRQVVRFGGVTAAVGYLVTAVASPLPLVLAGWCLVGFGVGMIGPQVYAVAGHMGGGRVLAVVVTFGYTAFLAGPAINGFLVEHLGIQRTMFVPAVLCLAIVAISRVMPRQDADLRPQTER